MMSTATAYVSPRNLLRDASSVTWSGSGVSALLAGTRAIDGKPDTLTRATYGGGGATVTLVLPAAITARLFVLVGTNLGASHTITLRLYSDTGATTLIKERAVTGITSATGDQNYQIIALDAAVSGIRAVRWVITGTGTDTYDIGEFWAGEMWIPSGGIVFETEFGVFDPSQQFWTDGSQGYTSRKTIYKELTLSFPALSESELLGDTSGTQNLMSIFARVGKGDPVFVGLVSEILNTSAEQRYLMHRLSAHGLITSDLRPRNRTRRNSARVYSAELTMRETR